LAVCRKDCRQPSRTAIRRGPVAVWEVAVFARTAGNLDHAVQRNMFDEFQLSHLKSSFTLVSTRSTSWMDMRRRLKIPCRGILRHRLVHHTEYNKQREVFDCACINLHFPHCSSS